jgi:uncharacterized membrane protein YdbT with pleckstrin-like domain
MAINKILDVLKESPSSFEGQEMGEEVSMILRRHPFFILFKLVAFALLSSVPIVFGAIFFSWLSSAGLLPLFFLLISAWYLGLWIALFYALTLYSLNVVIVTSERIIDNDQHALFNRKVAELHLHRVQDISVHTHGILETVLGFGDVVVQTAGVEKKFVFHAMPEPLKVKDAIMKLVADKRVSPTII